MTPLYDLQVATSYTKLVDKGFLEFVKCREDIPENEKMYAARLGVYWKNVTDCLEMETSVIDTVLYKSLEVKYRKYNELMTKYGAEYAEYILSKEK